MQRRQKRSFYRTANSVFGKIGRIASEETILQLIPSKCIPALVPTNKSDLILLDFVVDRLFMKLFKTVNIQIIRECQKMVLSYPVLSSPLRMTRMTSRATNLPDRKRLYSSAISEAETLLSSIRERVP